MDMERKYPTREVDGVDVPQMIVRFAQPVAQKRAAA